MDVKKKQVHSRILPPLVMAAWAGMFIFLLIGGRYQLFLKPEFGFLVIGGLVISGLFLFGILDRGIPGGRDTGIKALFLLLPILFIFSAGESTLGSYALSKRTLVAPDSGTPASVEPVSREEEPNPLKTPDTGPELTPISQLIFNWDKYKGKSVVLEGLFSGNIEGAPDLAAVYRYFVSCCAADAMPVGVFLARPGEIDIEENQWVRVAGQVTLKQLDGYEMIFMTLENIEIREKPSKNAAYLYN
ncbi:TIGR03943 family putative permease subunit [Desulfospira joergensenii]|uniref:TIGR03943 family putative permease subunit n=1 Tax=Desulfospira joergensenii TaxID=53329 RepID=UPI0003B3F01A|nr:TIGR03943 family protein [Desulfospira joergensenii]